MAEDQEERDALLIDLTKVDLRALSALPASVFAESLRYALDDDFRQPDSYSNNFQSAIAPD
jgi:hypothetical protein